MKGSIKAWWHMGGDSQAWIVSLNWISCHHCQKEQWQRWPHPISNFLPSMGFFYFDMSSCLKEPSPSLHPQGLFLRKSAFQRFWERNFSSFCKNEKKTQRVREWLGLFTIPASPHFCTYPCFFRLLSTWMCLDNSPILLILIHKG